MLSIRKSLYGSFVMFATDSFQYVPVVLDYTNDIWVQIFMNEWMFFEWTMTDTGCGWLIGHTGFYANTNSSDN